MTRGKAFLVVGHRQWGKSRTLSALTRGNSHLRYYTIGGAKFFIRRMSNDDIAPEFHKVVRGFLPLKKPFVIVALCPVFDSSRDEDATETLAQLARGYDISSFVLRRQFNGPGRIGNDEVARLEAVGPVCIYEGSGEEDERAGKLRAFVERSLG